MKKFLIVGCGGSGGATIRFLIDQLKADLRAHGVTELPAAWQFLSIDVPPDPESTPGLGTVPDMGGRYLSVSSPGNSYQLVGNSVEQALSARHALEELVGWAPAPKESCTVGVTKGAGQYRAIGRMLTLTDLRDIQAELARTWEALQSPSAWGALPQAHPAGGPYDNSPEVIPIVVGSMAGGSGAAMFLDVCRILGRLPGLNAADLGVFLFTADVFAALPASERAGVDANALGAMGEIIAAQSRSSDEADDALFRALGLPSDPLDEPAFARVFPIGSTIGGDGARFGDGSPDGVFRGLARALAATLTSERATFQYVKSKVENPSPTVTDRRHLGWGTDTAASSWGSYGYASLSLGRDRYAEYASQRLARNAVERLARGYLSPTNQLPANEQLNTAVTAQFPTILAQLQLPTAGSDIRGWFLTHALTPSTLDGESRQAIREAVSIVTGTEPGQAVAWLDAVRFRLPRLQDNAAAALREAAYFWASSWANQIEQAAREEFLRSMTQLGLPYAIGVVERLRTHLNPVIDALRGAPPMGDPLVLDPSLSSQAAALKKTVVGAGHALAETVTSGYLTSAQSALECEAARLAAEVLASYAHDVLGGLERAGKLALQDIEAAEKLTLSEAGLAQLSTTVFNEWPAESDVVPARFDHADNEVLLTTAREFPARFTSDVTTSVPAATTYDSALHSMVSEIVVGRWQTTGGAPGRFPVLTQRVTWRPAALPRDAGSQTPTPRSVPVYDLAVTTRHLLERSRAHLGRPDQPFDRFSSQSIEEYLFDPDLAESDRQQRSGEFVDKFRQALQLARPLVGVNPAMIQALHPGHSLTYQYSFSSIPLGADIAGRIRKLLEGDHTLDASTVRRFDDSLDATGKENRIAIYGSYPKYSPLVFASMLDQIQKRWAAAPDQALGDLWKWKRTRPLPAAMAMGRAEREAMVMGWFLGRLLGAVSVPTAANPGMPAQVWSFADETWLPFAARLLTPPARFQSSNDWLPAVLESHALAIVASNGDVHLTALRPYAALRSVWDDSDQEPQGAYSSFVGVRHLTDWLATGTWPTGRPSEIPIVAEGAAGGPQQRHDAAATWLDLVAAHIGDTFLTDGSGVGAFAERKVKIDTVRALANAPMFAEVAELAMSAVVQLRARLAEALGLAEAAGSGTTQTGGKGYVDGIM